KSVLFQQMQDARAVLRTNRHGDRQEAREDLVEQFAEDATVPVLGCDAGIAQLEHLVFGVMPAVRAQFDEDEPDDSVRLVDRDPGVAGAGALAGQRVERLLAFQRVGEQRDLRREAEQQIMDLAGILQRGRAIGDRSHLFLRFAYFSDSTRPRTNQRCISTTTSTGGRIASSAVAMMMCHSVCVSPLPIIWRMPITIVVIDGVLVTSSGHRYWFQP